MGSLNPSLNGTVLLRQANGSFLGQAFQGRPPNSTNTGTTPNFEQNFFNCSIAAGRTAQPVPGRPNLRDDLFGTMSRNPLVTDFIGDGASTTGFGVNPFSNQINMLHSLLVNAAGNQTLATHSTGTTNLNSMLVADFNGDARRDIAVLNAVFSPNGSVSIFLGTGNVGLLQAAVNYPVGRSPTGATTSDFNGDGRPDIAVASGQDNTVSVLINNGNGTFRPAVNYGVSESVVSIVSADVNGDGRVDLVCAGTALFVLGGNGDGTFRAAIRTGLNYNASGIAAGDFNKDGRLDLALSSTFAQIIAVFYGSGNGTFPTSNAYMLGSPDDNDERSLFAMDFDGDTHLDIVVASGHPDALIPPPYSKSVKVLFNRGDGSFLGAPSYRANLTPQHITQGDFNSDGKIDIAINANIGAEVFFGTGSGFQSQVLVPVVNNGFPVGTNVVAAGDFNGDGKWDLAAASNTGLFILIGNGNGSFQPATRIASVGETSSLAIGDLNADNRPDIVAAQRGFSAPVNHVLVFLGNGNGTFQNATQFNVGSNPVSVQLADLNGDNRLDIVAACAGTAFSTTDPGGVSVALGNGNGTFQPASLLPAGSNPTFSAAADVTGDGRPELFTSAGTGSLGEYRVFVHLNQGNGTFQAPIGLNTDFGPSSIAVGDFNGDGRNDLIAGHCCGDTDTGVYIGNGNGTFQPEMRLSVGESSSLIASDLNQDGRLDLVLANSSNRIGVLYNIAGTFPNSSCGYSLSRYSGMASSIGDALGVVVRTSSPTCGWTASSLDSWINVSSTQRQGPGAALLNVSANTTSSRRAGTVLIAGVPFTVSQPASGCSFLVSPQTITFDAGFSYQEVNLTTGAACQWSAQSNGNWLFTGAAGPGSRIVGLSTSDNSSMLPRTASVDIGGVSIQAAQNAANPPLFFGDVPISHPFYNHIALLRNRAITIGCSFTTYCPEDNTTRGQMAVFLIRGLLGTEDFTFPQAPFFTDVPATHPFFKYVQKLRELGITAGCSATMYCVDDPVTRGQMAAFIIRASSGLAPTDPFPFPAAPSFTDVAANHSFFGYIQLMKLRGITAGCSATQYCPEAHVTRGQMAVFIIRAFVQP